MELRIALVRRMVEAHYEPGRHDRSLKATWRRWVYPVYPMAYRTMCRYLRMSGFEIKTLKLDKYDKNDFKGRP